MALELTLKIVEIDRHFQSQRGMWITKCLASMNDDLYTFTVFGTNVDCQIVPDQIFKLTKKINPSTRYSIDGTKGDITCNLGDIISQIENPTIEINEEALALIEDLEISQPEVVSQPNQSNDQISAEEMQLLSNGVRKLQILEKKIADAEEDLNQKNEQKTQLQREITNLQREKVRYEIEAFEDVQTIVKKLTEFLPASYEQISKIFIDVREMKRSNRNCVLIKKEE